jgi:SP family general alpha glucoside:H+ symporter-like MFS transporter
MSPSPPTKADPEVTLRNMQSASQIDDMIRAAEAATAREKEMGVWQAIKTYPTAICYSMALSLCLIMEGYDTSLTNNFFALPQFRQRFGQRLDNGDYQLTASWMSGLQNGTQVGQILGLMVAGLIAERYGYKKTIIGALLSLIGFIFLFFFATNIGMLLAGGILCGIPWGAFQTLTTTYAADVTPLPLRPILTTFVNMCWVFGQLISTGVLRGLLSRTDDWAWRIPYAIQWVFPPPIILGVLFAPESPTWLVRKGRMSDARKSLRRLTSKAATDEDIGRALALLEYTDQLEKHMQEGTSYLDCFKGVNLRRTEIACLVWVAQVFCGIWFGGNVTYFLQQAGFDPERSFDFGIGMGGLAVAGTIGSWFIVPRVGRRTLYLAGLSTMLTLLLVIGFMGIPAIVEPIGWATGGLMMLFVITYDLTVGPVGYCLVAEVPSTRLRIKTVVLARNAYNIASIVANFLNPPILNPTAWNLRGKGGFVWSGLCLSMLAWTYFRLPETKGLGLSEMDVLFEQRVSARRFRKVEIDAFRREFVTDEKLGVEERE